MNRNNVTQYAPSHLCIQTFSVVRILKGMEPRKKERRGREERSSSELREIKQREKYTLRPGADSVCQVFHMSNS